MFAKKWPFIFVLVLIIIFFYKLFIPCCSIPITLDFGRSDILHLNYPIKLFLSESLKHNQLPLWNHHIGNGYPALAEGQMGTFNLVNLLLFKFLPMPLAFNLGLISSFLIAAFGMYLYVRILKLSYISAVFAAIVFSLSGFFITHIQHYNLIQTAAFLPIEIAIVEYVLRKHKYILLLTIFPLALSQQIFAGFFQMTVYSLVFIIFYFGLRIFLSSDLKEKRIKIILLLIAGIILGFGLSAIQLLPTYEFIQQSSRVSGLPISEIFRFPYKLRDIAMVVHPFLFGIPKLGTYPPFDTNWGIFWENNSYIGFIPLLIAFLTVITLKFTSKETKKLILIFLIITIIFWLLALGSSSPFHIAYAFPPLNYFRVPSRFLLIVTFGLVMLATLNLEWLGKVLIKKMSKYSNFIIIGLLALSIGNIFYIWREYNPYHNSKEFLSDTQTSVFLKKDQDQFRLMSIAPFENWNRVFLEKGWQGQSRSYQYFLNSLNPNLNLVFGLDQIGVYESLLTRRQQLVDSYLKSLFQQLNSSSIQAATNSANILGGFNVKYVIATKQIKGDENWESVFVTTPKNEISPYYVFQNQKILPRAFFAKNTQQVSSVSELRSALTRPEFDPRLKTIVEFDLKIATPNDDKVEITAWNNDSISISASNKNRGLLVVSTSYYPGWQAKINSKITPITPVNSNQIGILTPEGSNRITLTYKPQRFRIGVLITFLSLFLIILLITGRKRLKILEEVNHL